MLVDSHGPATGGVLLVGSVPLRSAEEVFQVMAAELGDRSPSSPTGRPARGPTGSCGSTPC
jgi:hypothetical protein